MSTVCKQKLSKFYILTIILFIAVYLLIEIYTTYHKLSFFNLSCQMKLTFKFKALIYIVGIYKNLLNNYYLYNRYIKIINPKLLIDMSTTLLS